MRLAVVRRWTIRCAIALCLAGIALSDASADKRTALQSYKKGVQLLEGGQWDAALRELKAAVEEYPRSGKILIGRFSEPYYPYFQMGLAARGKGDLAAAASYFSMEESEGKIQKDAALWQRFTRERGEAKIAHGGVPAAPASPPAGDPAAPPAAGKTAGAGSPSPGIEAPAPIPATPGSKAPPTQGQAVNPPGGGAANPPSSSESLALLVAAARAVGERLDSFQTHHSSLFSAAERQKLESLKQTLESSVSSSDPEKLRGAGAKVDRELADLRVKMAGTLIQKRGAFMSQDREKILRDLGERIDRAASGEDAAALSELSTHLDERLIQARDLSDRAYAAVRDAFAGAAAGDNDKAVRVLEGELAAQADCPVLRMILARFYFDIAVDRDEKDGPAMTRAREHVIQAFRLRPNLALPERYFPPGFLSLVREATGGKPAQNSRAPAVSPDPWSSARERSHPERRALG